MDKTELLTEAAVARRTCEIWNEHRKWFRAPGLGGMCGIASHFLFLLLRQKGVQPVFILADSLDSISGAHCWNRVGRWNIDITATQFEPCSPIYNFTGKTSDHPILRRRYKDSPMKIIRSFPDNFVIKEAKSDYDIKNLLQDWTGYNKMSAEIEDELHGIYKGLFV